MTFKQNGIFLFLQSKCKWTSYAKTTQQTKVVIVNFALHQWASWLSSGQRARANHRGGGGSPHEVIETNDNKRGTFLHHISLNVDELISYISVIAAVIPHYQKLTYHQTAGQKTNILRRKRILMMTSKRSRGSSLMKRKRRKHKMKRKSHRVFKSQRTCQRCQNR